MARIYLDYDDVLTETAKALSSLARQLFGRQVPYEQIALFNLQEAFSLSDAENRRLMEKAHTAEFLGSLEPTPGAVDGVKALLAAGAKVTIVTGRPATSAEASEAWLRRHGLGMLKVAYVDKYHRADGLPPAAKRMLTVAELDAMPFDLAVDDSPSALELLKHRADCRILIYDRPWNRAYPARGNMTRVKSWGEVLKAAGL